MSASFKFIDQSSDNKSLLSEKVCNQLLCQVYSNHELFRNDLLVGLLYWRSRRPSRARVGFGTFGEGLVKLVCCSEVCCDSEKVILTFSLCTSRRIHKYLHSSFHSKNIK